ncbi:hypothetical protein [Geobacillus genomosp. 3]|uniref:hypothetical protein n=1 Tax=Geobacillus genomosp. 3 TaxID=1921421 RepID=UPI001F33E62E|nr:hypothetical protein [Geobacillus genomosp. 3]
MNNHASGSMGLYKKADAKTSHVWNKKAASCEASGARMSSGCKTKRVDRGSAAIRFLQTEDVQAMA